MQNQVPVNLLCKLPAYTKIKKLKKKKEEATVRSENMTISSTLFCFLP